MSVSYLPSPPDHVPEHLIVDFDFFSIPDGVQDPAEIWHGLVRRGAPKIFYTRKNGGHWVFLDYEDICDGYRDYEKFSTYQAPIPPIEPFPTVQPQGVDPPQHTVFKMLLAPMFTPAAVKEFDEELHRRTKALIDKFADQGRCDFVSDYAGKLPTSMFLNLMGLPEERLPEFLEMANIFFRSTDDAERKQNAMRIYTVLNAMFDEKRKNPANDIATKVLFGKDQQGNDLPYQDILDCGFLLFVAGLDTVTNTMTYIWRYLATTPSAREFFRSRRDNTAEFLQGLEELFRINAVSNLFRRVAKDVEYKGVFMKQNDRLILPNTVANRDPRVFENPSTIDLGRKINVHVTFGVGPHRCVGQHLAKREIMISIQNWLDRIPDFSLAPNQDASHPFGGAVMGFENLPLVWDVRP